jgi:hypothetical protein
MKRSTVLSVAAVTLSLTAALSACAPVGGLDVFDRDQAASDALPAGGTANVVASVDADSTRLLWQKGETTFYAAKGIGESEGNTCLMIFEGDVGVSGCSTGLPLTVGFEGMPNYMLSDTPVAGDDWTKVADYLFVERGRAESS